MRRTLVVAFIAITLLSLVWPDPVVWLNDRTVQIPIAIDHHDSFEREPFQWDLPLWFLYGLVFAALFATRGFSVRGAAREYLETLPRTKMRPISGSLLIAAVLLIGAPLLTLLLFDEAIIAAIASFPESRWEPLTRPLNRLAGGSTPTLIGLFILIAGVAWKRKGLLRQGVGIALVALICSIPMSIAKRVVGRARPEAWEGAWHFFSGGESFPSGHTLSGFVVAAVVLFADNPRWVRISAVVVASVVAVSRVLTFRHWPSDVVASAVLALFVAWMISPMLRDGNDSGEQME